MAIFNMGSIVNEPPVLDSNYPADVTVRESATASATFKIVIATHGTPDEYTYQWYVNGTAVSGATGASYTKSDLTRVDTTDTLKVKTFSVYCVVTNDAGSVVSRTATLTLKSALPTLASGSAAITRRNSYDWEMKVTGTTTLKFSDLGNCNGTVQVFCVGGGGGGSRFTDSNYYGGGGGGGGYTKTASTSIAVNTNYVMTIGSGGAGATSGMPGSAGTATQAFNSAVVANGGSGGGNWCAGGAGGSGGGGGGYSSSSSNKGGNGGTNGGNGAAGKADASDRKGGSGQGTTTKAFGLSSEIAYAGGGGGGAGINSSGSTSGGYGVGGTYGGGDGGRYGPVTNALNGIANSGGGGGGAKAQKAAGAQGGSGIIIVRNN